MKTEKHKIQLEITPNSYRLIIVFNDKAKLFCSAKSRVTHEGIFIAGLKIIYLSWKSDTVFEISTADAARLLTRLARPAYGASLSYADKHILTKWETRVTFTAKDFEN